MKKIILCLVLTAAIALIFKFIYFTLFRTCGDCGKPPGETPIAANARLADPDLIYASLASYGLCSNGQGQQGGCYMELYLYRDGKIAKLAGFISPGNQREEQPIEEKQLGRDFANTIALKIQNAGLKTRNCPPQAIMDAGWNYEIHLDGDIKKFHNPPKECKDEFDKIDKLLNSETGIEE